MYLSNMRKKQIILNKKSINNEIQRIAFAIIEDFYQEKNISIIGFKQNGYTIAKKISNIIEKETTIKVTTHTIENYKESAYKIIPRLQKEEKSVFLVDDVLKSGKTIIYGIKEILTYNIDTLKTIILINRNHNKFPIGVDYVGLNLSTTMQEHIEVIMNQEQETAYLV